jgi:hypothetical protein
MTAATTPIVPEYEITDKPALPLAANTATVQGTEACWDSAAGNIKPGVSGNATLTPIGWFLESTSASSAVQNVVVQLDRPIKIRYWANDTVSAVTALFSQAYILDNQTVTANASGNSVAGRVWKIDTIKGIGVVSPAF